MEHLQQSSNRNSLLNSAVTRLTPDVFSHPVWVRFGTKEDPELVNKIDDLLCAGRQLQEVDPSAACQILLICAVYQNKAGHGFYALQTTEQALVLSKKHNLSKEIVWSLWGKCAILIQQEDYEQAGIHLVELQATLSEQNEWMLADFIDIFRQAFTQRPIPCTGTAPPPSASAFRHTVDITFDWLLHWGISGQTFETEITEPFGQFLEQTAKHQGMTQPFSSIQHKQGRWHTLLLAIRGELRFQWKLNDWPAENKRFSFWSSLINSVRFYFAGQGEKHPTDTNIVQMSSLPPLPAIDVPPLVKESTPPEVEVPKKKAVTASSEATKKPSPGKTSTTIPVAVHMLGTFRMTIGDLTVKLPASRSSSLLKYLLLHHQQHISREMLMEVFWPDAGPETARNNLNVAMHSLRKSLRNAIFLPVILFEDGGYSFEPGLQIWLDIEEFEKCVRAGRQLEARNQLATAVTEYETAISLYQGDLLEQNPYDEWTVQDRERLRIAYLDTLDRLGQIYFDQERYAACITVCQLILARDRCREDAHCLLMRCFSHQRQHHLALRQYQLCLEALRAELQVEPAAETTQIYNRIRRREQV